MSGEGGGVDPARWTRLGLSLTNKALRGIWPRGVAS